MERKYEEIFQFLSEGEYPPGYDDSQKHNFKQSTTRFTLKEGELFVGRRRVIKSEEEARRIFEELHSSPTGGHLGISSTRSAISSKFFWHTLNTDIGHWVRGCGNCRKVGKSMSAQQPSPCIKVSAVWELVEIDITGPFPSTEEGFQYILTATDYFSKWVEAFPMKTKSAAEVGRHICSMICRHGCPKEILSNQGKTFVCELNHQVCSLLGIERSVKAASHPQMKTSDNNIKRALNKLVKEKQNNWDVYLDALLFSIRSKPHTATKSSPFLLMYGREAVFPAEVPADLPLSTIILPEENTYDTFLEERIMLMKTIQETTMENIAKSQERQRTA